ncbi:hypothetical protein BDF21DRAFT_462075 [Thamnidium elegans]|nr:hypothetical protein BDF21DRAFT_462075 [Thamnidium elegans]
MSTLEAGLEQFKAENRQLKQEGIEPTHKSNVTLNIASTTPPDIPTVINSSEETDLIHKYSLLAPALMFIVLSHTMTMTTDQIITNSMLYDPIWATKLNDKSLLSNSVVWQNLLQSHQNQTTTGTDDFEHKEQEEEELQKTVHCIGYKKYSVISSSLMLSFVIRI